ncbi:fibronectin type III domain-containing protein [Mesonia hippocampi]|uniref:fibronectin type III domain-containing protein n=1 Tax=Mesonia hippocampi TaxID=1628250 RepID=UPI003F9700F7
MMKKITLILFTFFFVLSYHGQAQITIGDNTTTTSYVPINSCYGYSYSQQIFYQSDINDSGNITSVSFYVSSLPSSTTSSEDWTIYMGQTTKTEFTSTTDWVPHGNFTEVYSGNVTFSSVGSWMTITLDTPFVYDGTSNLVIAVDENQSGWNCSVRWGATNTSEYRSIYYRSDSTNPNPASPPTATGRYKYYSDIQLNITSSAICLSPSDLDVTAVTSTTADLSWIAGDSETLWNIEVVPSGTDPIGLATSTGVTNPYTITGLQPNTAYDFYVQADCGVDGYSIWKGPYVFVTACATNEQAPWSDDIEGHEEALAFTDSRCWTASSANAYAWNVGSGSTPSSSTGPNGASDGQKYFYIEAGQGATADSGVLAPGDEAMLETLPIDVSLLTMPVLSFDYHMYGEDMGNLHIDIHDGTAWVDDVFVFTGQQQTSAAANWEKMQIALVDYATTGTIQVRFRAERGNGDKGDIAIDAFSILQGATCLDPAALKVSNVTDITADVSWLDPNGSSWNIEVVEQGNTPLGVPTYAGVTSPYTLTGLTGLTSYEVYVQTDCGTEGQSNWVGPISFKTACAAFPLPVCENFDSSPGGSSTNPALPDCWSFIDSGTGYGYVYQWRTEKPFYMYNSSDTSGDYILVSPLVASLSDGSNWVTFDVDGSTGQELIVGTLASPADPATFTPIQTITLTSNDYESHQVVIPLGADGYLGFKHGLTGTYDSFYIDNICIEVKPACVNPTGIVVSNETDTSAEVSWAVNNGETSWNIEVVPEGSTPTGTPTYTGVTSNPYTMTGLSPSSSYEVYVQADCGVDGTSLWAGPISFDTQCDVVSAPFLETFAGNATPNCWVESGDDNWKYSTGAGYVAGNAGDHTPGGGTNYAWIDGSYNTNGESTSLITPLIDVSSLSDPILEFYVFSDNANHSGINPLEVEIFDGASWVLVETVNTLDSKWRSYIININNAISVTGPIQIRFTVTGDSSQGSTFYNDVLIDDIKVDESPLCIEPGALNVTNVTTTGADFDWSSKGNETSWNVEVVTQGSDPSGTPTDVVTGLPYSKTGLQPNTTYEYYVQADCGTDGVSTWAGPYTFTTACEVVVAPYTETFEDMTTPECWSVLNSTNQAAWNFNTGVLGVNDHTTSGLTNYAWVDGANNEDGEEAILISPMIDISALTTPSLDFYTYSYNDADTAVNEITVEFYDGTNWNTLLTQTSLLGDNWHRFVFDLSTYTISGDVQFRFKVTGSNAGNTSNHPVLFDDIMVDEMPNACLTPEEVMFSNYQLDAVDVTWLDFNDPQIGQWTIEYGPQGFTQGTGITETVTSLPYTITGLTSGVKYDLYIQGECSATSSTDWVMVPFAPLVEGATCEVAIDIPSLPYTFTGNTEDYQNHYSGIPGSNCGTSVGYLDGNEVVYTFTATTTELVDFSLSNLDGYYASLFVYEACADIGTNCVAGITAGPSQNDIRIEEFEVQAGQEYYVVVSSWLNPTVGFTLDIIPFDCATFEAPEGEANQEFTTGQTIADLTVETTRESNVTLNWYASDGVTPIADTTTLVNGETYYVSQTYNGCEGAQLAIMVSEIDCSTLAITNTFDASVNCAGVMELSATASGTGSETYWYDAPTGGNVLGIGSTFETPYLTQTTSYWASEVLLEGSLVNNVGEENWTGTSRISSGSNYWRGLYFRADMQFTINKVDVYDASSGGGSANIELYNTDTDALVASKTVTLPGGGSSANPVKVTLALNFVVPGPGNYKLVANDAPYMKYEYDYSNNYIQYPMPIGGAGEILEGGYAYTSGSNTYEYKYDYYYYYFYNWQITEGVSICESPRQEVIATVNQTGDEMVTYTNLPYTHTESTATYGNNFSGSAGAMCPGSLSLDGNDVIYHYTADPANDDILTIELSRITHPNTSMYIYSSCADIGVTCIAGVAAKDGASKISIEDYYVTAGDEFFIVISSTTGSTNYTLDISKVECGNVPAPEAVSTTPYYIGGDVLAKAIPILELTSSSYNEGYIWYADAGLTTPIDPATEVISSGATYYVTQTIFACEGDALAITPVEFDCSGLNVSVGSDIDVCSPGGDIVLTATPSGTGSEVVWYSDGTGGIIIGTGPSITVNIDRTTSFWVTEVFLRESATLCATQREELVVNVNYTPTATPTGLANQEFCGGARLSDIEITGTDIVWYENESSETPLPVNTVLEDGKVYYATQTLGACESLSRLPVSITVTDESDIPVGVINQGFELGSGAMVSDLDVQGVNLQWYADEYGLNPIADTTLLEDQTTYYVSQTISGLCESELLGITVHVDGLGTDDPTFAGVTYYPNPMKDRLTITNNNGVIDTYELYSLLGQRIEVKQVNADNYTINVSHLASGTYFIKVNIATKSTVFKLIKE